MDSFAGNIGVLGLHDGGPVLIHNYNDLVMEARYTKSTTEFCSSRNYKRKCLLTSDKQLNEVGETKGRLDFTIFLRGGNKFF